MSVSSTKSGASHLLPIHNIPQLSLAVTIRDVTSVEEALIIPISLVSLGIFEVAIDDGRASGTYLATNIVTRDIFAIVVDQLEIDIWQWPTDTACDVFLWIWKASDKVSTLAIP